MNTLWNSANKLAIIITIITGITGLSIYNLFIADPGPNPTPSQPIEQPTSSEEVDNVDSPPESDQISDSTQTPNPNPVTFHILNDMQFLSRDRERTEIGTFTSNYGDTYHDSYVVRNGFFEDGHVTDEIVVKKKYSKFTAVLAPTDIMTNVKVVSEYGGIKIIADDETVLYQLINSNSDPLAIEIDISDVNKLKILLQVADSSRYNRSERYSLGLGDIKFHLK